ncbi:MAG: hypothetical protein STHCBS139747_004682 [Sporothrix thermara]
MTALPVESSWRMVDGEHDSFDTSIVPTSFGLGSDNDDGDGYGDMDPFSSSSGVPSQQSAAGAGDAKARGSGSGRPNSASVSQEGGVSFSQDDGISLGEAGDSFTGSVGAGGTGGSQGEAIRTFLSKADYDDRVLLDSPFGPSVPSSARKSPLSAINSAGTTTRKAAGGAVDNTTGSRLDRQSYQTPEPEFRMPTIGMDGSLHTDADADDLPVSSTFHVSETGSPTLRRRARGTDRRNGRQQIPENRGPSTATTPATASITTAAWSRGLLLLLLPLLGLAVACGTPLYAREVSSAAVGAACSLPGIPRLGLSFCPPTPAASSTPSSTPISTPLDTPPSIPSQDTDDVTDASREADMDNYWAARSRFHYESQQAAAVEQVVAPVAPIAPIAPIVNIVSVVHGVGDLMRAQNQLAAVVSQHILRGGRNDRSKAMSGSSSSSSSSDGVKDIPSAQDAWLVPRAKTKDLRMAAQVLQQKQQQTQQQTQQQQEHKNLAALLVTELDAYLDATKHVTIGLMRLQTGAAAVAADTLAYRSHQTLAQLRRMAAAASRTMQSGGGGGDGGGGGGGGGGSDGWLARLFSGGLSAHASADRQRALLLDTYSHHVEAVLTKTQLRVDEADAVLKALERANSHLTGVQNYVATRLDELVGAGSGDGTCAAATTITAPASSSTSAGSSTGGGPGGDPMLDASGGIFSWLWSVLFRPSEGAASAAAAAFAGTARMSQAARAWSGYADTLQRLREDHEAAVMRAADTLDELAAVRDALRNLQLQFGAADSKGASGGSKTVGSDEDDLDLWLHMDIVEAGIHDLEVAGR